MHRSVTRIIINQTMLNLAILLYKWKPLRNRPAYTPPLRYFPVVLSTTPEPRYLQTTAHPHIHYTNLLLQSLCPGLSAVYPSMRCTVAHFHVTGRHNDRSNTQSDTQAGNVYPVHVPVVCSMCPVFAHYRRSVQLIASRRHTQTLTGQSSQETQ